MSQFTVRCEYVHPWPNAAGLFIARAKKLLLNQGIDFNITFGGYDQGDPVSLLIRGECDVAIVPPNRLVNARNNGADVVAVAALNQYPLESVISTTDKIRTPKDLCGRTLGMMPSARLETLVKTAVAFDGGDPEEVKITHSPGYEPDITDVEDGNYDSVLNIFAWEPLLGHVPEEQRTVLRFNEWGGPNYPSYMWVFRGETIRRNPALVKAFVEALRTGYQIAMEHPQEAVDALQPDLLNRRPSIIRKSLELVSATWTRDGVWGHINETDVANYVDWLVEKGLLTSADGLKGAIDNSFVD